MADDDWFESAFEDEGDEGDGGDEGDERADAREQSTAELDADGDHAAEASAGDPTDDADTPEAPDRQSDAPDAPTGDADDQPSFGDAEPFEDDGDLFDDDFATAFENAPDIGGGGGGGGGGEGMGASGGDDFDPGTAFGGGGGGGFDAGNFGGAGDSGGEPFEDDFFDDEEFESDLPRIDIGIEGLDSMIQGGVPERTLMTTIGSAGTGKTTFGLQFLHAALEDGENAVYITLEETEERIVNTATEKGWPFDEYVADDQLAVIDLDPIEMANSLTSIRNDLPRLIKEFDASRLVLDSVSLLEMMYDDQATRRNEIYDFTRSLKQAGVTTMLTSEASEGNAYASRHGIIEYLTDAVFILRYIRSTDDFRETRLAVEIQKIRDANHSREIKPYAITNDGISVYRQANIF